MNRNKSGRTLADYGIPDDAFARVVANIKSRRARKTSRAIQQAETAMRAAGFQVDLPGYVDLEPNVLKRQLFLARFAHLGVDGDVESDEIDEFGFAMFTLGRQAEACVCSIRAKPDLDDLKSRRVEAPRKGAQARAANFEAFKTVVLRNYWDAVAAHDADGRMLKIAPFAHDQREALLQQFGRSPKVSTIESWITAERKRRHALT